MRTSRGERVILAISATFHLEQASGGIQVRKQCQIFCVQKLVASVLQVTLTILDFKIFYRIFLLHPASQPQYGAGDALVPSGGANGAT